MNRSVIDMICFNQECIRNKNQLFLYESQQRIIHSNHSDDDCVNIHPHNFKRKYANQTNIIQETKTKFQSQLENSVYEIIQSTADMLKNMLGKQIGKAYDKGLQEFQASSCPNLLERIKNNQNAQYELTILNSLFLEDTNAMRKNITKKMQKCQSELRNYFKQLNIHITDEFQKIIDRFQPILQKSNKNIELPTQQTIKIEIQEIQPQKMSIEKPNSDILQVEREGDNIENNKNLQNIIESVDSLQDIRKYFKTNKTKQIKKTHNFEKIDRMMNLFDNNSSQNYQSQSFSMNNNGPSKISTCIIAKEADLIQIQKKSSNYQRLVIYYPLAEQDLLKIIRKTSPKQIFINYSIKLSSDFIQNIPEPILKQITRLEEYWDHNEFFDQRKNRQYFPIDDFRHIKSVNKLHLPSKHWNILPKLSNIWMSNLFDLQELKSSKKRVIQIQSLRIQACKCCNNLSQYVISQIFTCFKQVSSLKTLVLKCQILNNQNRILLRDLTLKNKKIQCIAIEIEGHYIPRRILQSFSHLPLTKLSINNEHNNDKQNVYMDVTPIMKIKSLKKLAMTNIFFTTKEEQIEQSQYIQQDEEASTKISSLPELTFIDLFRCSPIYTNVISELSQKVKSNLYHVNLSHTLMDNALTTQLYFLPKLKQLNLDRTAINLKDFFKEISKKPLSNIQKLSLFHYNGDYLDDVDQIQDIISQIQFSELNNQQIEKISTCFPNLEYLNIAFCRQFTDLPQSRFKRLKYLCSNKEYMTPAKIEKMKHHRGIQVYLYDGKYAAWIVPVPQKK